MQVLRQTKWPDEKHEHLKKTKPETVHQSSVRNVHINVHIIVHNCVTQYSTEQF